MSQQFLKYFLKISVLVNIYEANYYSTLITIK